MEKDKEQGRSRGKSVNLSALPWMRSPVDIAKCQECPLNVLPFLSPKLRRALEKQGFSSLLPVQVAVWQETIGPGGFDRDICVNSPTGSGKTLAYALPIVQSLSSRSVRCLRALVVLPTRDLALQVKEVFDGIAPAVGLSVGLAVGKSSLAKEISELVSRPEHEFNICYDPEDVLLGLCSAVDILVATPGRLMDHIMCTRGFTLEHLRYLVVDETDRLLREAYQSWLSTVLKLVLCHDDSNALCSGVSSNPCGSLRTIRRCGIERGWKGKCYPRLVKMVLSATLTLDPSKLAQLDLHHPLFLTTGQKRYQLPEKLEPYKLICDSKLKPLYLASLLHTLEAEKSIVFTSSVESTHRLCTILNAFDKLDIKIKEYSGLQRQSVRSKILKAFRDGKIQVLVSSDAMTRGMDVEGVKNVINYDMPAYIKTYIHRAGRTARAGKKGRCFTLLSDYEVVRFKKIMQKTGHDGGPIYSVPADVIESFRPTYISALEKLKEAVESESSKKRKSRPSELLAGKKKQKA